MDIPLDLKLFMNNATQKVYKCDQCNASYSDKSYFDLHKQTHQKAGGGNGGGASGDGGGGGAGSAEDGGSNGEGGSGAEELPTTVQIVMPAPAHQQEQQVLQQDQQQQQLTAYKRAYGGELHQIYEIAPSTRYQVVTSGTPHVLTAVTLASLPSQVTTLPSYTTTPTYVLAEQPLPQGITAVTAAAPGQRTATLTSLHQDHHHHHQDHQQQQVTVQQQQQQQATIQQVTVQQPQQQQQQATVQHHTQPQQQQPQQQQQQQQQRLVIALEPKERPYKCDQCTASFIDPGELTEHKKKHSGDGPFTCEDCHFTFMYKSHFRSHKTRCLKKRALMPHAPKPILNPGPIKRQFPTHHNKAHNQHHQNQHQQQQQQHQQQQHQQQQQQQQQQATTTPTTQHHHHHHTSNNTRSSSRVAGHHNTRQSGGSGGGSGNNAANTASFNPNNPSFKRQRKEQRQDRPFECSDCDASFQTSQDLQTHKAKHTGEGPFKCEECRFVFLYRKLYEAHRRRCEKKRKDPMQQQQQQAQQQPQQQQQAQLVQVQSQALQQQQQQVSVSAGGAGQAQVVQTASGQQVQIHGGRATLSAAPTTVQLSGPIQIQTVPGHPQTAAVIDMRSLQQQSGQGGQGGQGGQAVQHLQHPTLIEQVIHVTQVPSGSLGGGRQEIKYDLVPATVDVADVNQIMNLIKVKGHQQ